MLFSKSRDDHDTPDGSPIAEWDPFWFKPQPDITTYELALILMACTGSITGPYWIKRTDPAYWEHWPRVRRHFRLEPDRAKVGG